ncbi:MAG: hypothetical protein ACR2QM_06290 [Longimicrobiales bacterium]
MKSRLADLAHLAEIVGAFAVVVSLVYVGIQVNDGVGASRSASVNDANVALQSWYLEVGTNEQTSNLFYRGLLSDEALPNEEEFQFLMIFHGVWLAFQNSYWLAEEGTLDPELLEALTAAILGVKDTPGMQRYWRQRRSYLNASFGLYVDELLARETNTSMDIYRTPESN